MADCSSTMITTLCMDTQWFTAFLNGKRSVPTSDYVSYKNYKKKKKQNQKKKKNMAHCEG